MNWHTRAVRETDPFSTFVFLWFCLNAWLSFRSPAAADTDRKMIIWLKDDRDSDLRRSLESVEHADMDALVKLSPIRRDRNQPMQRADIHINGPNDYENLIDGIYRIRCNLFHGQKEDAGRDEDLIIASGQILTQWIRNLFAIWW